MASLTCFYYDPFAELNGPFADTFNARLWVSPSVSLRRATKPTSNAPQRRSSFHPRMNLEGSKDSNAMRATFEVPGFKPEDLSIDFHQSRLTVSGESAASDSDSREGDGYAVRERRYGKFSRTLQLPSGTKHEDVQAKLENGILTVTFPKMAPEQGPQHIVVE